jgi:exodeoxyribonuclease VII large subunit
MPTDLPPEDSEDRDRKRKVYRVSEISRRIKSLLEDDLGSIWLEGECSNVSRPASGHTYFTLKDETSQIKAALFKGDERNIKVAVRDGQKVRVYGHVTAWEKSSTYQIIVRLVEDAGVGALQAAFEALKRSLQAEGLFDQELKQPLPLLPRRIGVVTSPTGAAIRDIIQVLTRRFPNVHIILAPVKVQGEGSAESIARAIRYFSKGPQADVLIVGRGGGSLEDLWSFNEEIVARAIVDCPIPVISAVGHEIDFTICDFVADVRAPTPSAAAELAVPLKRDLEERIDSAGRRLARALDTRLLQLKNRYTRASTSYVFREPQNLVLQYRQTLDHLGGRMRHQLSSGAARQRERIGRLELKLGHASQSRIREGQRQVHELDIALAHYTESLIADRRRMVEQCARQLKILSPYNVLERGFSITRKADGSVVKTIEDVATGDKIETILGAGSLESSVTQTHSEKIHGGKK